MCDVSDTRTQRTCGCIRRSSSGIDAADEGRRRYSRDPDHNPLSRRAWRSDAVDVRSDELPVFWACGVTPQAAIETARLPFAIAHKPGHMLVTDIPNTTLAIL
jgi:hypothetical protein